MNYLLDTHTFLWALFSANNLSKKSSQLLLNYDNYIFVSTVTFWEISLKFSLGKLELNNILPDKLPDLAKKSGFEIFPINEYDVASFYKLPKKFHKDPFDRLLIWQAIKNNLIIISKDLKFNLYNQFGLQVIW